MRVAAIAMRESRLRRCSGRGRPLADPRRRKRCPSSHANFQPRGQLAFVSARSVEPYDARKQMRILVLGAAGMLGGKLVERLVRDGRLGSEPISELTLVDRVAAEPPRAPGFVVESTSADLAEPGVAAALVAGRPDVIFHLAAVVSGEAEQDLEKGYRVNVDATRMLLDAVRACEGGYRPRLVFSSSIAVFGPPLPDVIGDDHAATPATSYGTQKAMIELLLSDHARRGFVDGIAIRLPTICVRPGTPNLAASGFFSSIIREPLNGQDAVLPVSPDVRHWFAVAARSDRLPPARRDTGRREPRRSPLPHDARRLRDGCRRDRGAAPRRRRRCGPPGAPRARRDDRAHRGRLAARVRHRAARRRSGSRRRRTSTRSSGCTSRTSSAASNDPCRRRGARLRATGACPERPLSPRATAEARSRMRERVSVARLVLGRDGERHDP